MNGFSQPMITENRFGILHRSKEDMTVIIFIHIGMVNQQPIRCQDAIQATDYQMIIFIIAGGLNLSMDLFVFAKNVAGIPKNGVIHAGAYFLLRRFLLFENNDTILNRVLTR